MPCPRRPHRRPLARASLVLLVLLVPLALAVLTCTGSRQLSVPRPIAVPRAAAPRPPTGLVLRLGEGGEPVSARTAAAAATTATPLDDAATAAVLARLPALVAPPTDEQDLALRERSLPPPRPGATLRDPFPPPAAPPAPDPGEAGPLRVLRHAPDGEVPLAPHLQVTFSQPMVAVTSHADLAGATPVRVTPQPPGAWRWLGTRTILFQPTDRFPMATDYQVEIPAGTRAAGGGASAAAERFTFSTPPPTVVRSAPNGGPTRLDPIVFVSFDQKIDPAAVLASIQLRAGAASSSPALRLATPAEVEADDSVRPLAEDATPGRWLAFRAEAPLPPDTRVTVSIGPGTPSAEGPRRTTRAQEVEFRTYGPMKVERHRCGWRGAECQPLVPFTIDFTNPIDAERFDPSMVRVEPDLPGRKVSVSGRTLMIRGRTRGRTIYKVTLAAAIPDTFDQTLGEPDDRRFWVTEAAPRLYAPGGDFVVLDPMAGPRFSVFSVNHPTLRVQAWKVGPEHWAPYRTWLRDRYNREKEPPPPPGTQVLDETVTVTGERDELTETPIDLSAALAGGAGQVILLVDPPGTPADTYRRAQVLAWVQATRIGLDAFVDDGELVVWASALDDGRPLDGVDVDLGPAGRAVTGADGLATLPLADAAAPLLVARRAGDLAMLPEPTTWWSDAAGWRRSHPGDVLRWYVADDRGLYRPGEQVRFKGWIRRHGAGEGGDVEAVTGVAGDVSWTLRDSQGNEVGRGQAPVNALGGFDGALTLPPTMNLGHATLQLFASTSIGGGAHAHAFQVQEFRRPEFEVTATAAEGPHFVGGHADVTVAAAYYAGGGLPNAEVTWRVTTSEGGFTPPGRGDFTFGTWTPWWDWDDGGGDRPGTAAAAPRTHTYGARTDSAGKHRLGIDFVSLAPPRPTVVRAEATVTDVNRQAWAASSTLLVHPADLYVGLRTARPFVQAGEPIDLAAIVADLDGKLVPGRTIAARAVRLDWVQEKGKWSRVELEAETCEVTSAATPATCTFKTREGGQVRITASIADDRGRRSESQLTVWVAGGRTVPARDVEQERVQLVPDKREYRPGDTAEILVLAPFTPAEGVLTLRRSGIVRVERFAMTGPSTTVKVRVEEGFTPNVHAQVDLVGAAARTTDAGEADPRLPRRPAFASGTLNLPVPPLARTLALAVKPRAAKLEPGGATVVDVELRDAAGEPVAGGEVAVVVVDEAVLALTGYDLPDPVGLFYGPRPAGARDHHLRASVRLARPGDLGPGGAANDGDAEQTKSSARAFEEEAAGAGGPQPPPSPSAAPSRDAAPRPGMSGKGAGGKPSQPEPIRTRIDFNALAVFAPAVPTDAAGRAEVAVRVPDNLTRYRVMAVAVAGSRQFGRGESTITARLPLMVRASPPRFLNFGDRFELPVVVQNQTDEPFEVDVAVRVANAELTAGAGRRLTVPANDRVEVRFPAATARAGVARFQVGAVAGRWADASEHQLPVWTPATTEAFATYGTIDDATPMAQPVSAPTDAFPQFGGLEITTSATALQGLTDAVLYLVVYPFECAEQMSSRVLAIAALRDVLSAFQAGGLPSPAALEASIAHDVELLGRMQNADGGFPFWTRGYPSWPFLTTHVTHALQRAREKGYAVPDPLLARAHGYLRAIESHLDPLWGPEARRAITAYALYVRTRLGDPDPARARGLITEAGGVDKISLETLGWLLPVLATDDGSREQVVSILRHLANRVEETAGAAHFTTAYGEDGYLLLHSDRRVDGVLLEALIGVDPDNDVIPKLVTGLLAHRKAGRWLNTQENAFVLLALDRYFATYEKATPDFLARAWLGERFAGEHRFRGRTTDRHHVDVPMRLLADAKGPTDLIVTKTGAGRLYYRIGMRYAPRALVMPPADHGFVVLRAYEAVDDPADVRRDGDGAWRVKAGARVRVRLTMVAPARRYHVALVDPIPAGLEPLNPALAVTGALPADANSTAGARSGPYWWWARTWFEHQNLRDERVEAFTSLLWEGVHEYTYVARATTPGTFVAPPTKAEEMYSPETFGRAAGDRVIVE